jgi:hypothetical protein
MKSISHLILVLLTLSVPSAFADSIGFSNVTESDLKAVIQEFSSNFTHSTVTGANTLGSIFGFEVGLIAGVTPTPKLEDIVKKNDPNAKVSRVYDAGLMGQISVPFGITVEALMVPKMGSSDFKFQNFGLGVKWTITEDLIPLPLSIALRAHYTNTKVETEQTIVAPNKSTIEFTDSMFGANISVSKDLLFVEPYVGMGYVTADGKINVSGGGTIFDTAYTTNTSAKAKRTSGQFFAGAEFKLLLIKLGAEYSRQFDTNRYLAKLSVFF